MEWPMRFAMKYRNADDTVSEREVMLFRASATHIVAYCLLRRSNRTFRIDRIVNDEVIDVSTGEVIRTR